MDSTKLTVLEGKVKSAQIRCEAARKRAEYGARSGDLPKTLASLYMQAKQGLAKAEAELAAYRKTFGG
jgi:hypothetical protein